MSVRLRGRYRDEQEMTRIGKALSGGSSPARKGKIAAVAAFAVVAAFLVPGAVTPAQAATVGQGFTITPSDLVVHPQADQDR